MTIQTKKSFSTYMRSLHRDIGYFTIGLVIIYSLSGILLIFRNTEILKHEVQINKTLAPNLEAPEIAREIHFRDIKITRTESEVLYFQAGTYNKTTGVVSYTTKEIIFPFNKFIDLHTASGKEVIGWFTGLFGLALLFLALSSFWMFNPKSKSFKRALYLTGAGIVVTIIMLLF